jgi:hypothetical protein
MRNKFAAVLLCLISSMIQGRDTALANAPNPGSSGYQSLPSPSIPDDRLLELFFVKHAFLLAKAEEKQSLGRDGNNLRMLLSNEAGLDQTEALALDRIAIDAMHKLREIDRKARHLISDTAKSFPDEKLPYGVPPPPIPPALLELQHQRQAVLIDAQQQLHAAWGDATYTRFYSYLRDRIIPQVQHLVAH